MARYKRSYGLRRRARSTRKPNKYLSQLLRYGASGPDWAVGPSNGLFGELALQPGDRYKMFGPSFRQRLFGAGPATAKQTLARRAFKFYGDGDYGSTGSQYGLFNFGSGAASGNRVSGLGEYTGAPVSGNQIIAGSVDKPITVNSSPDLTGDVYFSHREFVGNVFATATNSTASQVVTSSNFNNVSYPINAGLSQTFPWLSQVANNFTMYELMGCIFEYKPTSGEFGSSNSNALGKVILATQYDPDANDFTSSVQMENYDYATACKPSERMLHGIETKSSQMAVNMLYVRNGTSAKDKVFTDYGTFQVATEGIPMTVPANTTVTSIVGEMWVSYKVKLSRAQIVPATAAPVNIVADLFKNNSQLGINTVNGVWNPTTAVIPATNTGLWTVTGVPISTVENNYVLSLSTSVAPNTVWLITAYYFVGQGASSDAGAGWNLPWTPSGGTMVGLKGWGQYQQQLPGLGSNGLQGQRALSVVNECEIAQYCVQKTSVIGAPLTITCRLTSASTGTNPTPANPPVVKFMIQGLSSAMVPSLTTT